MVEPNKNDLKMLLNYRRLKSIRRCNTFNTISNEDVAQHSFYVTMLAMAIGDEYNAWATEHNLGFHPCDNENLVPELNMEMVLRKSLLHDTEEAIVSDIPWNIKHSTQEFHDILSEALNQKLSESYKGTHTLLAYFDIEKDCKKGFEGELVNLVDMMELGLYCWEEWSMGNHSIKSLLDKCIRLLNDNPLFDTLRESSPLFISLMEFLNSEPSVIENMYFID